MTESYIDPKSIKQGMRRAAKEWHALPEDERQRRKEAAAKIIDHHVRFVGSNEGPPGD